MKRASVVLLIALAAAIAVALTASGVGVAGGQLRIDLNHADEYIQQRIAKKERLYPRSTPTAWLDFDAYCMQQAQTQEQIDQLEALRREHSMGLGQAKRKALQIIGELPADQPRLTLAQVQRIVEQYGDLGESMQQFNAIAGAPDFSGGSGISFTVYFLNDQGTDCIHISLGRIDHILTAADGTTTSSPIGRPPDPSPGPSLPVQSDAPQ